MVYEQIVFRSVIILLIGRRARRAALMSVGCGGEVGAVWLSVIRVVFSVAGRPQAGRAAAEELPERD